MSYSPKALATRLTRGLLLLALCSLAICCAFAQEAASMPAEVAVALQPPPENSTPEGQTASTTDKAAVIDAPQPEIKFSGRSFVIAPIPISSPAIGSGIVPVGAYIFPFNANDKVSPASVVGALGLITNNGTQAWGLGAQLYMKQDLFRVRAAFARGNINYDVFGNSAIAPGQKLALTQTGKIFVGEFMVRLGWKFYLGPRVLYGSSVLTHNASAPSPVPDPPDLAVNTNLTSVGFRLYRDSSSNRFYPTDGSFFNLTSDFFSQGLGSKYTFQSYRTTLNKYQSLTTNQVLAYNGYLCATGGDAPFYGKCIYGTSNELRGYTAGHYFTRYMAAAQMEYRLALPMRLGLVAFGGVGGVKSGSNQLYAVDKFLPAGGGGLRLMLSRKYHVNLRGDLARGRDGHTFSMGVGEAF
jgi:Omp85 superfamily domain